MHADEVEEITQAHKPGDVLVTYIDGTGRNGVDYSAVASRIPIIWNNTRM